MEHEQVFPGDFVRLLDAAQPCYGQLGQVLSVDARTGTCMVAVPDRRSFFRYELRAEDLEFAAAAPDA